MTIEDMKMWTWRELFAGEVDGVSMPREYVEDEIERRTSMWVQRYGDLDLPHEDCIGYSEAEGFPSYPSVEKRFGQYWWGLDRFRGYWWSVR